MNKAAYLEQRIDGQIKWYSRKSRSNKNAYRFLRVLSAVVALSIPIMSGYLDNNNGPVLKIAISVAGALVALCEALLTLFKFRDNWTNYRDASENLTQHKYLFSTGASPYNTAHAFILFVQNAEGIMAGERVNWVKLNTMPEEKLINAAHEEGEKEDDGAETAAANPSLPADTVVRAASEAPQEASIGTDVPAETDPQQDGGEAPETTANSDGDSNDDSPDKT